MENNKEVKNIADHQEQHPVEAPPPQGYPPSTRFSLADSALQPPELQRLPMEGIGEERKANSEIDQASGGKPDECCCCAHGCLRGLQIDSCIESCLIGCCRFPPCLFICFCMAWFICFCRNGCSDSLYK